MILFGVTGQQPLPSATVKTMAEPIVRHKTAVDLLSDDNLLPTSK